MDPPRRRTKKGERRMDAALDAMSQYGFEQKIVRLTIKELLKVYDGEWSFMEEFAYKLLIDTIIDKQEIEARTQLEITNRAETSALKELVVSDLPDPLNSIPLSGPSDKSAPEVEFHRYPRRKRRSNYAERVKNILGAKRSSDYSKDRPCKRTFCHGYLGDDKQDELIDVEPRSAPSAGVPVALLLSPRQHKEGNNPSSVHSPKYSAYCASQKVTKADRI